MKFIDLTGNVYGRLTVIKRAEDYIYPNGKRRAVQWLCKCECGTEVVARGTNLSGHTSSCGCLNRERIVAASTTHNLSNHLLYKVLANMWERCYSINHKFYKDYGGRGIFICPEWNRETIGMGQAAVNFITWAESNGYKKGLSIDRVDNDKGYSPDNCRWTTQAVQNRNQRPRKKKTA